HQAFVVLVVDLYYVAAAQVQVSRVRSEVEELGVGHRHAFVHLFGTLHHFIQVVMDARLEPHLPGGLPDEIKPGAHCAESGVGIDRKSTRLNSSHQIISYAVFCLKKKKKKQNQL